MPRIPQYTARYNRPAGTGMVPISVVPDPLSGVGESIAGAAQEIGRAIEARNERKRIVEFGTLAADFERDLANDYVEYTSLKGAQAYGSQERLDKFEKLAMQKYKSADPLVNDKLALYIRDNITGKKVAYNSYEAGQEEHEMNLSIARMLDTSSIKASNGVGTLQENVDTYTAFVGVLHASGSLSEEAAAAQILKGERQIAAKTLEGMIYRSPDTAVEQLKSGIWNDKIHPDALKRFRSFAETASKNRDDLRVAAEAAQQKAQFDNAIVELTNAKLSADPERFRETIGKHMSILTSERKYDDYMEQLQKMVNNKLKKIDEDKKLDVFTDLYFKAKIDGSIKTEADLQQFRYDVANAVSDGLLPPTGERSAEFLINKAGDYLRSGDSLQAKAMSNAKSAVGSAYNMGKFGKKKSSAAILKKNEILNGMLKWYEKHPDARLEDIEEFTQQMIEPEVVKVPGLFGEKKASTEQARDIRLKEFTAEPAKQLPSDSELRFQAKTQNFKSRSQLVRWVMDNYDVTRLEAIDYLGGLE